jgi:hypothetical protein
MDLECDLMDYNTPKHVIIFIWNQMLKFETFTNCNHDVYVKNFNYKIHVLNINDVLFNRPSKTLMCLLNEKMFTNLDLNVNHAQKNIKHFKTLVWHIMIVGWKTCDLWFKCK